jgi:phosphoglycerol transferase MdoB-like AlkP superfamily enzyme
VIYGAIGTALVFNLVHYVQVGRRQDDFFRWHTHAASLPYTSRKFTHPVRWMINGMFYVMEPSQHYEPPDSVPASLPIFEGKTPIEFRAQPHVLILQIESLSGGAFEWNVQGKPVMPFTRSLVSRGVYFPNTLTTKMTGGSFDADLAVLTGFHPPPTSNPYGYLFSTPPYFGHLLAAAGYETYTYDNHVPEFMKSALNHAALGISKFFSIRDRTWTTHSSRISVDGPGDREFLAWVADRILEAAGPSFFFARTISSHGPYIDLDREPEIRETIGHPFQVDSIGAQYAMALRYVDTALQYMLARLWPLIEERRLVLILYGDHGSGITIRQESIPGLSSTVSAQRNVPLLILGSGHMSTVRLEVVSIQDIPVTLARLLGVPFSVGDLGGRDLFSAELAEPLVTPTEVLTSDGIREPTPAEREVLIYGYRKLGAPR